MSISILLVAESAACQEPLKIFLTEQYRSVKSLLEDDVDTKEILSSPEHTAVVLSVSKPKQRHLELLQHIQQHAPKVVAVFADETNDDWIMKAVNVGANSIVIDGIKENRIKPIMEIATARFERCMTLRDELSSTRQKLEERRDIDRAKGILMKKKKIDEDTAYQLLRKMAMDKNQRIGEVANTLILAAELLD